MLSFVGRAVLAIFVPSHVNDAHYSPRADHVWFYRPQLGHDMLTLGVAVGCGVAINHNPRSPNILRLWVLKTHSDAMGFSV